MENSDNKKLGVWFKTTVVLFLIGNIVAALAYGSGLYLAIIDGDLIPSFEYLRVPLYLVDLVAFILLLRGNIAGFIIIVVTSCIYTIGAWYLGAIVSNIFAAIGSYNFYMFLLTATVLPFLDVTLLYLLGKQHITSRLSQGRRKAAPLS